MGLRVACARTCHPPEQVALFANPAASEASRCRQELSNSKSPRTARLMGTRKVQTVVVRAILAGLQMLWVAVVQRAGR